MKKEKMIDRKIKQNEEVELLKTDKKFFKAVLNTVKCFKDGKFYDICPKCRKRVYYESDKKFGPNLYLKHKCGFSGYINICEIYRSLQQEERADRIRKILILEVLPIMVASGFDINIGRKIIDEKE
jgi:hypothetical protein